EKLVGHGGVEAVREGVRGQPEAAFVVGPDVRVAGGGGPHAELPRRDRGRLVQRAIRARQTVRAGGGGLDVEGDLVKGDDRRDDAPGPVGGRGADRPGGVV